MPLNRLLIIDDEPDVAATIGRIARRSGYDSIITTEPDDFLSRCRTWHPTVIVMDLSLPGVENHALLDELARSNCTAQVLIISGHTRQHIEEAQEFGRTKGLIMAGALQKPLRVEALRIVFDTINTNAGIVTQVDITDALASNQFYLAYQPQVSLHTMQLYGVEALARWMHPTRGPITPATFIPMVEESGLADAFAMQVVDLAIPQLQRWRDAGVEIRLSMNVSAHNFRQGLFSEHLAASCAHHDIDPQLITLELTEHVALEHVCNNLHLQRLINLGTRLSIDDFGTGYSSLVQLHRLPFSEIKIDRSFVVECMTNRDCGVFTRAIIDLAHNLEMSSVAEGVESNDVLMHLIALGCDLAQGYAISRPLVAREFYQWALMWRARGLATASSC